MICRKLTTVLILSSTMLVMSCSMNSNPICDKEFIDVQINDKTLKLETACSIKKIEQGLMYRTSLEKNSGMIFVFPKEMFLSFWMKNTYIPLDIAYINKNLIITQIEQMQAQDLTPINSEEESMYAIEVTQNWFSKNNIKPGDKIKFLD